MGTTKPELAARELLRLLYYDAPLSVSERRKLWMNSKAIQFLYIDGYYERCLEAVYSAEVGDNASGISQLDTHLQQIERDLHRIGDDYANKVSPSKLRNICRAMCAHDTETGYTQSMNIIGAKLLSMLGGVEHDAFWAFVFIASFGYTASFNHRERFHASSLMADVRLIEGMMEQWGMGREGSLLDLVHRLNLDRNLFATIPLSMLLSQNGSGFCISREDSDRLWDYMFATSHQFVILCAIVAIMVCFSAPLSLIDDHSHATEFLHCTPIQLRHALLEGSQSQNRQEATDNSFEFDAVGANWRGDSVMSETRNGRTHGRSSHSASVDFSSCASNRKPYCQSPSFASVLGRVMRAMESDRLEHLHRQNSVLADERRRMKRTNELYKTRTLDGE